MNETGPPLDSKADNEAVPAKVAAVEVPHSVNPLPHYTGGGGESCVNGSSKEVDCEASVGGLTIVFLDGDFPLHLCWRRKMGYFFL